MTIPTQHILPTPYPVGPVHCYSTEINGELVLFDTGPPTKATMDSLRTKLDLDRLKHVIITHCHIDHYGLAHWLEEEFGATIYLPYRDSLKITRHEERLKKMYMLLLQIGFDPTYLDHFKASMEDGSVFPALPKNYQIIEDGLPEHLGIEAIACPGHSQSDLVLVGANWAVTGDVLLRGIFQSPLLDIDLLTGKRFRNYDAYCDTLVKLTNLQDKLILPGHRQYIESTTTCQLFYVSKLLERGAKIKQLPSSLNAAEVVTIISQNDPQQPFLSYLKASEVVFIRDFLAQPEKLQQTLQHINLFEPVADLFDAATN